MVATYQVLWSLSCLHSQLPSSQRQQRMNKKSGLARCHQQGHSQGQTAGQALPLQPLLAAAAGGAVHIAPMLPQPRVRHSVVAHQLLT
jgi:hypothetical protein